MPNVDEQALRLRSKCVFQGTVDQVRAATVSSIKPDESTVIVTVDSIEEGPPAMQAYRGKQITVRLAPGEQVQKGEQVTFYANPWMFGDSLAVTAVGHRPVAPGAADMTASGGPMARLLSQGLDKRIATADAVVTGRVVSIHLPGNESGMATEGLRRGRSGVTGTAEQPTEHISEHDPLWREAVVEVNDVQKGIAGKRQVVVRFPSSRDVRWYRAPKFRPGQEGVFVLHKAEVAPAAGVTAALQATAGRGSGAPEVYTALNANDFHPIEEAEGIDLLVRAQGSGPRDLGVPAAVKRAAAVKKGGAKATVSRAAARKKAAGKAKRAKHSGRKR